MIKTPLSVWNKNNLKTGMTDSERILACLARKTFLNFWGYSNPYTDKSRGREICDFMVIFGNDIILFSDKACEFPEIDNLETAWCRWHKSAIKKSVRQLSGASSFIKKFPDRIFMDPGCNHPLPVPLPSPDKLKIHLVAVTRGSSDASKRDWGNESSSSLFTMFINAPIEEDKEDKIRKQPFMVTWPFKNLKNREFVHVLDELTLEILLNELDTASDFISYLTKKDYGSRL